MSSLDENLVTKKAARRRIDSKKLLIGSLSFIGIGLLWELVVLLGSWKAEVFPGPVKVLQGLWELAASGVLWQHIVASLYRVTVGFYLAVITAVPLGILLGKMPIAHNLFNPVIQFLRPISPLAWIPIAMLLYGIGDRPAIFLIFLASFFPMVVATYISVSTINPIYFRVASNFGFSRWEVLWKVIFPAITPDVVTALRLTVAVAWLVVVAAEMIAVRSGLGFLILDSRNALRMDYVMAGMIVIGVIGLMLDLVMQNMSRFEFNSWKNAASH